jgi:outer membrane protein OmpA-like peptidoglycan-associated protein
MRKALCILLLALLVAWSCGCASMTARDKGLVIGGASGAVLGSIIGNRAGNTAAGAILGAVVGGATGAVIGNYMDKQAAEMQQDLEGARVERIGEGIKITFASGILFDVNKSDLRPEAQENIAKLAAILIKYEDTNILIEGHTDADGSEEYNLQLSERRARAVQSYLAQNGVMNARISIMGYGESQPVADNTTVEGKQANRRVEVAVMANEKLKKAAEAQAQ